MSVGAAWLRRCDVGRTRCGGVEELSKLCLHHVLLSLQLCVHTLSSGHNSPRENFVVKSSADALWGSRPSALIQGCREKGVSEPSIG